MTTVIVVEKRRHNAFQAIVKGHPEMWGRGRGCNEAIGDLVRSHLKVFNVILESPESPQREVIAGQAQCGCVYHAEQGIPCEHDKALAASN